MRLNRVLAIPALIAGLFITSPADAQTACCSKAKKTETSGCSPSNCRGATTKFGEAKVITNLRKELIALKADMEKSTSPVFSKRSYDIHGILGESDDESIAIIAREVQLIEKEFSEKKKEQFKAFDLPENKAKQVRFLKDRIKGLKKLLA